MSIGGIAFEAAYAATTFLRAQARLLPGHALIARCTCSSVMRQRSFSEQGPGVQTTAAIRFLLSAEPTAGAFRIGAVIEVFPQDRTWQKYRVVARTETDDLVRLALEDIAQ